VGDFGRHREVIRCAGDEFASSHFGADLALIRDMRQWYDGVDPVVGAGDGLEATRMVMAAHQSIDAGGTLVRMKDVARAS